MNSRVFILLLAVVFSLLLSSGCVGPEVSAIALKYDPEDSTTYRVTVMAGKSIEYEGPLADDPTFSGGSTSTTVAMTYTQQIEAVENGNAIANIKIRRIQYSSSARGKVKVEFDSNRRVHKHKPLKSLIGQSYKIKLSPRGELLEVLDVRKARSAVALGGQKKEQALALISDEMIKIRHGRAMLPEPGSDKLKVGETWSSVRNYSFPMMGEKSYERIYTLEKIEDVSGVKIAVAKMEAIPASGGIEDSQDLSVLTEMFDTNDIYVGRLEIDLNSGKIRKYSEELRTQWLIIQSAGELKEDEEPSSIKMTALRSYKLELIR